MSERAPHPMDLFAFCYCCLAAKEMTQVLKEDTWRPCGCPFLIGVETRWEREQKSESFLRRRVCEHQLHAAELAFGTSLTPPAADA